MNKDRHTPIRSWIVAFTVASLVACFMGAWAAAGRPEAAWIASASPEVYDVVIRDGRVMDPESGLDAIRNVGIRAGVIRAIRSEPLAAHREIDPTGLVVAPGFIDVVWEMPHAYQAIQLLDGVTTALNLLIGTGEVDHWYAERQGKAVMNFGVSVGHERIRRALMRDPGHPGSSGDAMNREASDAEIAEMRRSIERGLASGALAVSLTNVTPAASGWETLEMFRAARQADAVVWAPPRETGNWEADDMPRFLSELIGVATVTGTELCVVHIQASGGPHTPRLLRIVEEARAQGLRVTAQVFPYTSNLSNIRFLDSEDWQTWPDAWFHDLEWLATGERLTRETYARYRELDGYVVVHNHDNEPMVTEAVSSPFTLIASGAYLDEQGHGHPRASGTHARILGQYVREKAVLSLGEALRKMTLMPAQLLEGRVPAMKSKGRIREGADADIVVFDAGRINERATFREPTQPSEGVRFVLINGAVVVQDGVIQQDMFAGRPVRGPVSSRRE
jgi:N-acyl-D-aspartate/D-glutamate deacylase